MSRVIEGRLSVITAVVMCVVLSSSQGLTQQMSSEADSRLSTILADVHRAIYGGKSAGTVNALRATGRATLTPTVGPAVEESVELRLQQPDRYLRIFSTGSARHYRGLKGTEILNSVERIDPTAAVSLAVRPTDLQVQRDAAFRTTFALLGVTLGQAPPRIIVVSDRNPIILRVQGGETSSFDVTLDADHLPAVLSYGTRVRMPLGPAAPPSGSPGSLPPEQDARMEVRLLERKWVDGVSIPSRLRSEAKGVVFEDLKLDAIEINPGFKDADFTRARGR